MERNKKLMALAQEAIGIINEVFENEAKEKKENLMSVTCNEYGDTIIFTSNDGQVIEYSLSEIWYIFKDNLKGFEVFSKEKYNNIYSKLLGVQEQTKRL